MLFLVKISNSFYITLTCCGFEIKEITREANFVILMPLGYCIAPAEFFNRYANFEILI